MSETGVKRRQWASGKFFKQSKGLIKTTFTDSQEEGHGWSNDTHVLQRMWWGGVGMKNCHHETQERWSPPASGPVGILRRPWKKWCSCHRFKFQLRQGDRGEKDGRTGKNCQCGPERDGMEMGWRHTTISGRMCEKHQEGVRGVILSWITSRLESSKWWVNITR